MEKLRVFFILIPVVFVSLVFNGIIHEAGHGLFVLLFGGEINYIQPLIFLGSPHISYSDLSMLGYLERALVIVGGTILPVLVGILGMVMIPFLQMRPVFAFSLSVGIFSFVSQILAWIVLPVIYFFRGGFQGDDTVAFIEHTGVHPFLVSFFALLVFVFCTRIFLRKTLFLVQAKNLHRREPLKPQPYKNKFPGLFSFSGWILIVITFSIFSFSHMESLAVSKINVSLGVDVLEGEIILEKIALKETEEKTLIFNYYFQVERGNFSLGLVNPNGELIKVERHTGEVMRIRSSLIEVPINGPGEWVFLVWGRAEGFQFDLSYFLQ